MRSVFELWHESTKNVLLVCGGGDGQHHGTSENAEFVHGLTADDWGRDSILFTESLCVMSFKRHHLIGACRVWTICRPQQVPDLPCTNHQDGKALSTARELLSCRAKGVLFSCRFWFFQKCGECLSRVRRREGRLGAPAGDLPLPTTVHAGLHS